MTKTTAPLDNLLRRIVDLAKPVGFEQVSEPTSASSSGTKPPVDGWLWESSYAIIYVCPSAPESLESVQRDASYWLDDVLREHESEGRPMDGYLVLVIKAEPSAEIRRRVREIEQDPSFCRKHVLWPTAQASAWENRLERVTVLALADVPSPAEPARIPEIPARAKEAWARFRREDNVKAVVRSILADIGLDEGGF